MSGPSPVHDDPAMPKMHHLDAWDAESNAPSGNFVYDFDVFRYWVRDEWREVFSHTAAGGPRSGSVDDLADAFSSGSEVKVGISGLCDDLADGPDAAMEHQVFIQVGSCYHYTEGRIFVGATHPLVRVTPAIPLAYVSGGWDFGWVMLRTDGYAELLIVDPYTLATSRRRGRYAARWFVR